MIDRRTFLVAAGGLVAGAAALRVFSPYSLEGGVEDATDDTLEAFLRSLEADEALGKEAAARSGEPLVQDASRHIMMLCWKDGNQRDQVHACVRSKIADDFGAARVTQIGGWWLSYTEVALLGLAFDMNLLSSRVKSVVGYKDAKRGTFAAVQNWGPQATNYGQGYNVQPDGHSAFWIALEKMVPGTKVVLDGRELKTTENGDVLTTAQYEKDGLKHLLYSPGRYELELFHPKKGVKQLVGVFEVDEDPMYLVRKDGSQSKVYCPVSDWGPQHTQAGQAFNPQPDGGSAFWIKTRCYPSGVVVKFGEHSLVTSPQRGLITARVTNQGAWATPGEVPVTLLDPDSGESYTFGVFEIRP